MKAIKRQANRYPKESSSHHPTYILMGLCLWLWTIHGSTWAQNTKPAKQTTDLQNQQTRPKENSKPLQPGEPLPKNIILNGLVKAPGTLNLDQQYPYQKLLLVSFWSTSCVPCIREIALLDSLKQIHPDAFNAIMVSAEPRAKVEAFLARQGLNNTTLHFLSDNRQLDSYFPHRYLPHTIWIDQTGTVSAITGADSITEGNLLNFNPENAQAYQTKADDLDFNPSKPLDPPKDRITYRSTISGKIAAGNAGAVGGAVQGMAQRFFTWNSSISYLYYNAYSLFSGFPGLWRNSLIEVHTQDSLRLFYPTKNLSHLLKGSKYPNLAAWEQENSYCYELQLPKKIPAAQFRRYLFDDLEKAFGIRASIIDKPIRCHVVTLQKNIKLGHAMPRQGSSIQWQKGILECRNINMQNLFSWIFARYDPQLLPDPFLLTQLTEAQRQLRFDLDLSFQVPGKRPPLSELFEVLKTKGILVQTETRPYPILLLQEN